MKLISLLLIVCSLAIEPTTYLIAKGHQHAKKHKKQQKRGAKRAVQQKKKGAKKHKKALPGAAQQLSNKRCGAGVLPYCQINGKTMFLMGKEGFGGAKGQWADFGGGFDGKKDKNSLDTAVREGTEETRYVFGNNNFKKSVHYLRSHITHVIYHPNKKYAITLVKVHHIPSQTFKRAPKVPHWEKTDYEWIPAHQFLTSLKKSNKFGKKRIRPHVAATIKANSKLLGNL